MKQLLNEIETLTAELGAEKLLVFYANESIMLQVTWMFDDGQFLPFEYHIDVEEINNMRIDCTAQFINAAEMFYINSNPLGQIGVDIH